MKKDLKYGLPTLKKYPMPDAAHVRSAIKFFNYVDSKHEEELANAILARMDEYGMSFDDFGVGDENRFKQYMPKNELKHHGIKGMHWGIRRYQNPDGTLTDLGKKHYSSQGLDISTGHKSSAYSNLKAIGIRDESDLTQREVSRLTKSSDQLGKEYYDNYNKAIKTIKDAHLERKQEAILEARKLMKEYLVSAKEVDDDEFIDMIASDISWDMSKKYAKQTPRGKEIDAYINNCNKWFDDVRDTTDRIVSQHGDQTIEAIYNGKKAKTTYKDVVDATLRQDINMVHLYAAKNDIWDEVFLNDNNDLFAKAIADDFRKNT